METNREAVKSDSEDRLRKLAGLVAANREYCRVTGRYHSVLTKEADSLMLQLRVAGLSTDYTPYI